MCFNVLVNKEKLYSLHDVTSVCLSVCEQSPFLPVEAPGFGAAFLDTVKEFGPLTVNVLKLRSI